MTEIILLSCPPDTPESKAALTHCTKQALQSLEKITCIFFIGHGVAHAIEQCNNNINEWQNLGSVHQIPLYYCTHSMDQLLTPKTPNHANTPQTHYQPRKKPFQTAGLGTLVEACINSSTVTSFAPQNMLNTRNPSIANTVINTSILGTKTSQSVSITKQETEKSIPFNLYCHDIMCHITVSALFNIALMLLVFEQKVTIHLQDSKSNNKTAPKNHAKTIDVSDWTTHHATALTNLKDMGMDAIILDNYLAPQLATPLQNLGLYVTISTNIPTHTPRQTPEQNSENKDIYI